MTKFWHFIIIFVVLFLTNQYAHDYQALATAFSKQQQSFGHFFILVSQLVYNIGLPYIFVHSIYLLLLSISLATITKNITLLIIVIVLIGEVLNEQVRFFSAAMFAVACFRNFKLIGCLSFLIHPAAFVIVYAAYFGAVIIRNRSKEVMLILSVISIAASIVLKEIILKVGRAIGYNYEGSEFLEPISMAGLAFILLLLLLDNVYRFMRDDKDSFSSELTDNLMPSFILLTVVCSGFAIVAGRLLMILTLIVVASTSFPKFISTKYVLKRHNHLLLLSSIVIFITLAIRGIKFLGAS